MEQHSVTHNMNREQEHVFLEKLYKSRVLIGNIYIDYFGNIWADKMCDCLLIANRIKEQGFKSKSHLHLQV